jgi:hypothetical protein
VGTAGTASFEDTLTQNSASNFTVTSGIAKFKDTVTNTIGVLNFSGTGAKSIISATAGNKTTLAASNVSPVYAINLDVKDCWVSPNGIFNTYTGSGNALSYGCVNSGNTQGWYFIPAGATFSGFF